MHYPVVEDDKDVVPNRVGPSIFIRYTTTSTAITTSSMTLL